MRNPFKVVGEMATANFDVSRSSWFGQTLSALRSFFTTGTFFRKPIADGTQINYDLARSLYRNDATDYLYGGGFVRPIIDLTVEYMGLPTVSTEDGDNDAFLNECIREYWAAQLQEVFRDATRDSKTVVRFYQPRLDNALFTVRDRKRGRLEVIPPESVDIIYDPVDKDLVIEAVVTHEVEVDERTEHEKVLGTPPRLVAHQVREIISREWYRFYDVTAGQELETWETPNVFGFVPLWEVINEFAADLNGGQSDLEAVLPFIEAFHQVLSDSLAAHRYHSIPKVRFNVKQMQTFINNNWPGTLDENGRPLPGAKIKWEGKEILFMQPDEDAGFIEAQSVLGDSKTLLDFLIECISIASETPRWALLKDENSSNDSASIDAFEKKIARKRIAFAEPITMLLKMVLAANGKVPETPKLNWPEMRLETLAAKAQAVQQLIMSFDVATAHEWLADETVRKILAAIFREVNAPDVEKQLARSNVIPEIPAPAPASPTQGNQNGAGNKSEARKALTTTSASNS